MGKNILILAATNDFLWKFERENVKLLQKMGYTVHYASNMHEPNYISDEAKIQDMAVHTHHIEIARSPFLFQTNRKALAQLLKLIDTYQIQAIHCHTPVGGLLGRLSGKLSPKPKPIILYTAHGFHFYKGAPMINLLAYRWVEKYLARYTDILIVINNEDYENAKKLHLKKNGMVFKIPGVGLDRDRFKPFSENKRKIRRNLLGIEEKDLFLLSIGELNENKNQHIVLEALKKVKQKYQDNFNIKYAICGDGFFRNQIEEWIVSMGLTGIVKLYGYCTNIPDILGCADATIFPSKREGLGMAGLESLAMGIPVIASDNRGTREYMVDKKNGFVCKYDDLDGFVKGIEAIKNMGSEERIKMKKYCQISAKPFDRRCTISKMEKIYGIMNRRLTDNAQG